MARKIKYLKTVHGQVFGQLNIKFDRYRYEVDKDANWDFHINGGRVLTCGVVSSRIYGNLTFCAFFVDSGLKTWMIMIPKLI